MSKLAFIRSIAWKLITYSCYAFCEFFKICFHKRKNMSRNMNIFEVCFITIANLLDAFKIPFKCCKCQCCQYLNCFQCCVCCKCCQCEKENEKEMTYEDIEKGANEFNKFLTDQIDVCNHLKEEDKKLTESSSLKGKLGSIKNNYRKLVEILNE